MMEKQNASKVFQGITLTCLPLLWMGYFYALYIGNQGNVSSYTLLILAFSLLNADALFGGKKIQPGLFRILAKINGVLFVVWAVLTVVQLLLR